MVGCSTAGKSGQGIFIIRDEVALGGLLIGTDGKREF